MADVTGSINLYKNFRLEHFKGLVHPLTDTFVFGLSTSLYVPDSDAHAVIGDISGELVGNGYSRQTMANPTVSEDGAYYKWRFDNPVFTASGGDLTARYWWLFDDTHPSDILVAWGLIKASDEDVVLVDGQPLTMIVNANGLFRQRLIV